MFVDEKPAAIEEIATDLGLDVAQLHGEETPESIRAALRIWKAFRVKEDRIPRSGLSRGSDSAGWTAASRRRPFDWTLAARFRGRVILAGGLDAGQRARRD